ncbi:MAG: YebC/PmpR family DNA-binding transcriptional regulator [Acidimicrobiales bacterium]
MGDHQAQEGRRRQGAASCSPSSSARSRWRPARAGRPGVQPDAADHVPEGPGQLGAARHHRAGHQAGTGELEGVTYEQITYEGYAPNGVAILIEVLTDNRNRTGSDIRSLLKKTGGSIAEPGSVAWQFERKGVVILPASVDEDDIMLAALDAGADDLIHEGDTWRLTTAPTDLPAVRAALEEAAIPFDEADVTMLPTSTVPLGTADAAKAVLRVIDALEDNDDVQDVYANFDIPDDVLQAAAT